MRLPEMNADGKTPPGPERPAGEAAVVRHPIWVKIFLGSLLPTLVLVAAAFFYHQHLAALGQSAAQILSQNYRSIKAAEQARKTIEAARNRLFEQMSRGEPPEAGIPDTLDRIGSLLAACRENITEVGERELVDRLLADFSRYQAVLLRFTGASEEIWQTPSFKEILKHAAALIERLDELVALNEAAMERADKDTRLLAAKAQRSGALLFAVAIITMLALSFFLSVRIAKPVMALAQTLSKAKEGSGAYPQLEVASADEVGFLTAAFNRLFRRLERHDHYREEILAAEKEKVRRSEEAKGKFIADISHQLKTPMTSLAMSVSMLHERGGELGGEARERLLETARDDCSRLSTLINELVDLSRLEAMATPRPKETIEVSNLVRESLSPLRKQAEEKQIRLDLDIPPDLPPITIDSFRFPWVLTNLVGNALRYTEKGGAVSVRVRRQGRRFYFECIDTGSGIDPCFLPRIFNRYTQFSERGKCGTIGLGLAIVKDIIDHHHGDIQVESHLGQGTKFVFWVPDAGGEGP